MRRARLLPLLLLVLAPAALAAAQPSVTPAPGRDPTAPSTGEAAPGAAEPAASAAPSVEGAAETGAAVETEGEAAPAVADQARVPEAPTTVEPAEAPKVAVVLVGDPEPRLQALARRIDESLEPQLRRPFDPGLRAALRGEDGRDDGLDGVRSERRRLGLGESSDAPVLATLGRRAGAVAVAVVRPTDDGPELVVLDVRNGAFFEGTLPLSGEPSDRRVAEFVARRARTSARHRASGATASVPAPEAAAEAAAAEALTAADPAAEEEEEPGFFEQFWPYLVAGALLAAMITAIAVTAATEQTEQPVLRFVPGGR